ncbi:hypothetical protein AS158_08865 [Thermotoga sp. 38H-to]|uniref:hypothetical protein n=1 Tax=Thermotoga sp. Mc24 TaxID=1231241 RepID=UPI000570AB0D|nr:hypothetical protein [Thermotoga sp. Mc24]KAF2959144.1 hypothetical protein AS158_08865 [Thermotoga sp. 38H-to]
MDENSVESFERLVQWRVQNSVESNNNDSVHYPVIGLADDAAVLSFVWNRPISKDVRDYAVWEAKKSMKKLFKEEGMIQTKPPEKAALS